MGSAAKDYRFVAAKAGDLPTIRQIVGEVLAEYDLTLDLDGTDTDIRDPEGFRPYLSAGGAFLLVLDPEGKVVGTGGLWPKDWHTVELRKMYLLPEARGRGLGRRLLNRLLVEVQWHGYQRVCLETNSRMTDAIGLYEHHGFTRFYNAPLAGRCDRYYILNRFAPAGFPDSPPPYRVPRRFGMAGMIGIPVAVALYVGALQALGATGWTMVFWVGLPAVVAPAQAFLFGGRQPRAASMVAGSIYCTVWTFSVMIAVQDPGADGCALLASIIFGGVLGYLTGAAVGGVVGLARGFRPVDAAEGEEQKAAPSDDSDPFSEA